MDQLGRLRKEGGDLGPAAHVLGEQLEGGEVVYNGGEDLFESARVVDSKCSERVTGVLEERRNDVLAFKAGAVQGSEAKEDIWGARGGGAVNIGELKNLEVCQGKTSAGSGLISSAGLTLEG